MLFDFFKGFHSCIIQDNKCNKSPVSVCVCVCSVMSDSCDSMDCCPPGSSVHGQEYWSELPFPSPGNLPYQRIKHVPHVSSALADGFFTTAPSGSHSINILLI